MKKQWCCVELLDFNLRSDEDSEVDYCVDRMFYGALHSWHQKLVCKKRLDLTDYSRFMTTIYLN